MTLKTLEEKLLFERKLSRTKETAKMQCCGRVIFYGNDEKIDD